MPWLLGFVLIEPNGYSTINAADYITKRNAPYTTDSTSFKFKQFSHLNKHLVKQRFLNRQVSKQIYPCNKRCGTLLFDFPTQIFSGKNLNRIFFFQNLEATLGYNRNGFREPCDIR